MQYTRSPSRLNFGSATRLYLSRCLRRRTINVQSRLWEHSPNIGKRILTRTQSYWPPAKIRESSIWAMGRFCHSPVGPQVTVFQTNAGYGFQQLLPTPLPPPKHHTTFALLSSCRDPIHCKREYCQYQQRGKSSIPVSTCASQNVRYLPKSPTSFTVEALRVL